LEDWEDENDEMSGWVWKSVEDEVDKARIVETERKGIKRKKAKV